MISYGEPPKKLGRGPKFIMCYICGKQFGKSSLPIHEKACLKKWHAAEGKLFSIYCYLTNCSVPPCLYSVSVHF